jgi:hypothetical protein
MVNKQMLIRCVILAASACVTLVAAHFIRHQLIEPVTMGVLCEKVAIWQCRLRDIAIFVLQESRLGWGALALVCIAYFKGGFLFALLAWWVSCIGLVLYTPELCAVALLLAGLLAIRVSEGETQASTAVHIQ